MDLTLFLSQLIGIVLLVMGVSGLLYPERMKAAMQEFKRSTLFPMFDGAIALVVGVLIVLYHNVWTDIQTSIISAIGWLAVAEGLAMYLLPEDSMKGLMKQFTTKSFMRVLTIVAVLAGAYLVYLGFFA